jgi:putative endonuclease
VVTEDGVTYHVYILASQPNGTLYIGITNNLALRLSQHKGGRGSEFAQRYAVNRLAYVEGYDTPSDAIRREKQLKKWNRAWKIELIEKNNPDWQDLSDLAIFGIS